MTDQSNKSYLLQLQELTLCNFTLKNMKVNFFQAENNSQYTGWMCNPAFIASSSAAFPHIIPTHTNIDIDQPYAGENRLEFIYYYIFFK